MECQVETASVYGNQGNDSHIHAARSISMNHPKQRVPRLVLGNHAVCRLGHNIDNEIGY